MKKNREIELGVELKDRTHFGTRLIRNYVSAIYKPLDYDEDVTARNDIFITYGVVFLRYVSPRYSEGRVNKRGFYLMSHDKPFTQLSTKKFSGWREFQRLCDEDWRFDWIDRCTDINEEYLDIAAANYGCYIPIAIDFRKYMKQCGGHTSFTTREVMKYAAKEAQEFDRIKKESRALLKEDPE